jgi:hypothetical protein
MRQGLIMACAGCDAGAESGAYKVKRGETPIIERPESKEGTSRKDGECCGGGEFGDETCKRTVN